MKPSLRDFIRNLTVTQKKMIKFQELNLNLSV